MDTRAPASRSNVGGAAPVAGIALTRRQSKRGLQSGREPPLLSSNIDGLHSWACGRGPTLLDSTLERAGDDFLNIHLRAVLDKGLLKLLSLLLLRR